MMHGRKNIKFCSCLQTLSASSCIKEFFFCNFERKHVLKVIVFIRKWKHIKVEGPLYAQAARINQNVMCIQYVVKHNLALDGMLIY